MKKKVVLASILTLFLIGILPITSDVACADESNDRLVGAAYMTFWGTGMDIDWSSGAVYWSINGTYSSNDSTMANYHIKLAIDHNVDFFVLDHGWGNSTETQLMENATLNGLLKADNIENFRFCIFYFPYRVINSSFVNETNLTRDFSHINETYLGRASYLKLDNRSVVILADFPMYLGKNLNYEEINDLFLGLKESYSLYLIPAFWPDHDYTDVLGDTRKVYDAITLWGAETIVEYDEEISYSEYLNKTIINFEDWNSTASEFNVSFVPLICPGYDNTIYYNWTPPKRDFWAIVNRDAEAFKNACRIAGNYSTAPHNMVLLFTWNDFKEGTSIEPTTDYDREYLEIVRDYIPEFPSFLIMPLFVIATLLAVIVYRRKQSLKECLLSKQSKTS